MKRFIAVFTLVSSLAWGAVPIHSLIQSNLTVNGYLELNGTIYTNLGAGGAFTVQAVDEAGTTLYTNVQDVTTLQFDQESGLHVKQVADGIARVFSGSHWYSILANGVSNFPSGAQDIQFAVSDSVSVITWNTNTTPWTLTWPLSEGAQGPRGYPGFTFAIYAGVWQTSHIYTTNMWINSGGKGYGVVSNFTSTAGSIPNDYLDSGVLINLYSSGENGINGENGNGLAMYGNWEETGIYPAWSQVRHNGAVYYTETGEPAHGDEPPTGS